MATEWDFIEWVWHSGLNGSELAQIDQWLGTFQMPTGASERVMNAIALLSGGGYNGDQVSRLRTFLTTGSDAGVERVRSSDWLGTINGGMRQPTAASTATPVPSTTATTPEGASARAIVESTLAKYGLGSLSQWAWEQYLGGAPIEQIFLDMRDRDEYKARFPGMSTLSAQGRAVSEAEYISLERTHAEIRRSYGLPEGFYDSPDDFADLIGKGVSPVEHRDRLELWSQYAGDIANDPQNQPVLAELERLYGIGRGSGEFLSWVMDEDTAMPLIRRQLKASELSTSADRVGFGGLAREEAERLAAMGVTGDQAAQGFGALARSGELFSPIEGNENEITRGTQIAAAFEGNVDAQEEIQRRARGRVARFEGGSGYRAGEGGVSGLG